MTWTHHKLIAASVTGRSHSRSGRASQDSWAAALQDGQAIAAVADGCSAGRRSELGAGVGARFAVASAARRVRQGLALRELPAAVFADLEEELRRMTRAFALDDSADERMALVAEHLLFTLHVVVAKGEECVIFGMGDGVYSVDGTVSVLDQGGAPDYPAYAILDDDGSIPRPRLVVHHLGRFTSSLAIATDGAGELIARAGEELADGRELGGLCLFERDPRFLANASLAQKRLLAWAAQGGPEDDCTFVVVRRQP